MKTQTQGSGSQSEPGAPAPAGSIALCTPNIGGHEWEYIKECLDTGWVSSVGSYVERFERLFAEAVGAHYAVAMGSGTAALHVALLAAGVPPDTEVVLPALTFIAPANAVRYVGAWPTFVDVDPAYWQIEPDAFRRLLADDCERSVSGLRNRATGRQISAVLPVDILGHPCDHDLIRSAAEEWSLTIIEDATESLGARYRGRPLGSLGPVTCFSFNGNKLLTTGGGGMLVTDDEVIARKARYLSTQAKDDPLEFVHNAIGFNYRLTNIQAAMGCAQIERLAEFLESKRRIARRYNEALGTLPGITPMAEAPWAQSAFWMYTILVEPDAAGITSRQLLRALEAERIQSRPLWQPLHLSPAHASSHAARCDVAERVHSQALSLPCSTSLTERDQARVIDVILATAGRP